MKIELCSLCDEPTGRAGKHDDSIYRAYMTPAEIGPLCKTCDNTLRDDYTEDELQQLRDENIRLNQFVKSQGRTYFPCPECGRGMTSSDGCLHCENKRLRDELEKVKEERGNQYDENIHRIAIQALEETK